MNDFKLSNLAPNGYQPQAIDTSIEADLIQFSLLRQCNVEKRLMAASALIRSGRDFSYNCLRNRFSKLSSEDFAKKLAQSWLQEKFIPHYEYKEPIRMSEIQDSIQLGILLHQFFTKEQIPYFVTGGVAAIAYGEPRTTQDIDIVLFLPKDRISELITKLTDVGFYIAGVDEVMNNRSQYLSLIHLESITKADLIIADDTPYERSRFQRRQSHFIVNNQEICLISPEDIIISKLLWSQQSQSQKQWRDILGILKIQEGLLDYEYLYGWAKEFKFQNKIFQATIESGVVKLASEQWVKVIIPIARKAFKVAEEKNKVFSSQPGIRVATGNFYNLVEDKLNNTFTIIAKINNQEIAQWNQDNLILKAQPSLEDRHNWEEILKRLS